MTVLNLTRRGVLAGAASTFITACSAPRSQATPPIETTSTNGWRDGPSLPLPVQEIYPTLHRGHIHLAGGFIAEGGQITGPTDRHVIFDPITQIWSESTPLPAARHHPQLIAYKDALYALGGFETQSPEAVWVMQAGIWIFDGEAWREGPALPQPNGESVSTIIGDHLHICGGRHPVGNSNASWADHSDIADHFVLTSPSGSWERAAPLPTARNSAAAAMISNNWHVVGGRTVAGGNTPAHEVYDAIEDRWRSAAPMPQGQGGLAAASVAGKLYAFGGEYFNDGGGVYPDSWVYDLETDTWDAIAPMPHPRHGLGAVSLNDAIYVIGGALEVGGSQTSALVETYTP